MSTVVGVEGAFCIQAVGPRAYLFQREVIRSCFKRVHSDLIFICLALVSYPNFVTLPVFRHWCQLRS
jgi:hypothetical protein